MTERVASVRFTATEPLEDGVRDSVELSFQVPDAEGETLAFPTIQTCEEGETAWTQVPEEGQDAEELDTPAPSFVVEAAAEGGHGSTGHDEDEEAEDSEGAEPRRASERLRHARLGRPRCGRARPGGRRDRTRPEPLHLVTDTQRPARWRQLFALAATVLVAAVTLLATAGPAAAHATLVGTDPVEGTVLPDAPEQVTLTFSEPVRLTAQEITVYDAEGGADRLGDDLSGSEVTVALPEERRPGRRHLCRRLVRRLRRRPPDLGVAHVLDRGAQRRASPHHPPHRSPPGWSMPPRGSCTPSPTSDCWSRAGLAAFVALVLPLRFRGDRVRARLRSVVRVSAAVGIVGGLLLVPVASVYAQGLELTDLLSRASTRPWSPTRWSSRCCWSSVSACRRGAHDGPASRSATTARAAGRGDGRRRLAGGGRAHPCLPARAVARRRGLRAPADRIRLARRPARAGPDAACPGRPGGAGRRDPVPLLARRRWTARRRRGHGIAAGMADPRVVVRLRRHDVRTVCCWSRSVSCWSWPPSPAGTVSTAAAGRVRGRVTPTVASPPAWSGARSWPRRPCSSPSRSHRLPREPVAASGPGGGAARPDRCGGRDTGRAPGARGDVTARAWTQHGAGPAPGHGR